MLKRYYGLNEAAEFLSAEHKQQIQPSDVLEMAARGEILLRLWCDGLLAVFEHQEPGNPPKFLKNAGWFRGYIHIPSLAVVPRGGVCQFEQVFIAEEVPPLSETSRPIIGERQFIGHIGSPEDFWQKGIIEVRNALMSGSVLPIPFTPIIDEMVVPAADLLALSPAKTPHHGKSGAAGGGGYVSKKLATLNQAATRFWENADPSDKSTHPDNDEVSNWLIQRGYSETLAKKGASIVRPEWAFVGRKPEE